MLFPRYVAKKKEGSQAEMEGRQSFNPLPDDKF